MRANITDAQQRSIISIVAKIPVAEARKPFLVELEKQLPKSGKVSDEALLASINSALRSFPPGSFCGDAQGAYPSDLSTLTLKEAADLYQRMCRQVGAWTWPPKPPPTPEQLKAREAHLASMSQEQRAEAYEQTLSASYRAEEAERRAELARREMEYQPAPFSLGPSPPTTRTIRGEIEPDAHEQPEQPIVPLSERARPKQLSIYGRHLAWLRGELPENLSDEERAEALNEKVAQERRERRRLQGAPKAFF